MRALFMDARTDRIQTDSLKLESMKDQSLKNSETWITRVNYKHFVPTDYSRVCSDHFVKGKTSNFCAYNFGSRVNVSQIKLGKIIIDKPSQLSLIHYLFQSVNTPNCSELGFFVLLCFVFNKRGDQHLKVKGSHLETLRD